MATVEEMIDINMDGEPVIKDKWVPVWVLVSYNQKLNMSPKEISDMWKGLITEQEIEAAIEYWRANPDKVIDKLAGD